MFRIFRVSLLLIPTLFFAGCDDDASSADERGVWTPTGKADEMATCEGACGGQAEAGCWCDDQCAEFGDCCDDIDTICNMNVCEAAGGTCVSGFVESCAGGLVPTATSCGDTPIETTCCEPAANDCVAAGGSCVEGFVQSCGDGNVPTATSCGDTPIETTCCEPAPNPCVAAGGACVPGLLESCGDGLVPSATSCGDTPIETTCCEPAANDCVAAGGSCVDGLVESCAGAAVPSADSCGETAIETTCCLPRPTLSCAGACGGMSDNGCWCDDQCQDFGDCCPDMGDVCPA